MKYLLFTLSLFLTVSLSYSQTMTSEDFFHFGNWEKDFTADDIIARLGQPIKDHKNAEGTLRMLEFGTPQDNTVFVTVLFNVSTNKIKGYYLTPGKMESSYLKFQKWMEGNFPGDKIWPLAVSTKEDLPVRSGLSFSNPKKQNLMEYKNSDISVQFFYNGDEYGDRQGIGNDFRVVFLK